MTPRPDARPLRHILLWALLAVLAGLWRGPLLAATLRPERYEDRLLVPDFFQEWASARNRLTGLPVYTSQEVTFARYLGKERKPEDGNFIRINAHPPTAVLLALPLAGLDFADAFTAWNLLSLAALGVGLGLIVRQLTIPFAVWSVLPLVALLLVCNPLYHQLLHGQLNLVLLLLVTGTWAADRSGYPRLAGVLLGLATAVKLFPGFLLLFFIVRRRWQTVWAAAGAFVAVTALTAVVLGPDAYRGYLREGLPEAARFSASWRNISLPGLWLKLFRVPENWPPVVIEPVIESALLARLGALLSAAAVVGLLVGVLRRAATPAAADRAFALTVVGMLLISPITWDHYLLLLLLPLAVFGRDLPRSDGVRFAFGAIVAVLCVDPAVFLEHCMILTDAGPHPTTPGWLAGPVQTLTALSVHTYALVGLFVLGLSGPALETPADR
jgi:Glycosyltransferase family 87